MQSTTTFSPATAIVTGSDSGIGKATAVALAASGLDIGVTWHSDRAGAEDTAAEVRALGRKAVVRQLDTTDLQGAAAVIDTLADELGGVDVFVNTPERVTEHCSWTWTLRPGSKPWTPTSAVRLSACRPQRAGW